MTAVIERPPPAQWGADLTGPAWKAYALEVGKFNDSESPEFRPSTLPVRVGDHVEWSYNSIRDLYTIVQAKSADEPCTRLPDGLYAEPLGPSEDYLKNTPESEDTRALGLGYAWFIPYNTTESTVHYYAEGHCEQGMRGSFVVSGIASSSISPEYTNAYDALPVNDDWSPPYGEVSTTSAGTTVLSKPQVAGLAVGLTGAVLALGFLARFIYRRKRAQKTEKLKGPIADMIHGVQVTRYDGVPIEKSKTRDSAATFV